MKIKQSALRVAAAATVTVFMSAGAIVPAYAVSAGYDDTTTQTSTQDGDGSKSGDKTAKSASDPDHSDGTAGTSGDASSPQPESNADENDGGANAGSCEDGTAGSYCSTRDGSDSENGKGDGEAKGKPCAGCVGKADNKNPKGQSPDGSDHNAGYECDTNQGVGQSNPAHTGCTEESPEQTCPEGATMSDEGECVVPTEETCPEGASMNDQGECVLPTEGETCPEGATMSDEGECVVPTEETCPEDATMSDEGECVVPAEEAGPTQGETGPTQDETGTTQTGDEVLGVEAERSAPQGVQQEAAVAGTSAEIAPSSGILPDTGAGRYGLPILAGIGLLAAGGVLLARRRPQAER